MGVEEEAVKLAQRWGAEAELARRAGILHDCTKYYELPEQLDICAKYGVELDELEQKAVKLLHSKTGACIAREYSASRMRFTTPSSGTPRARRT